MRRRIKSKIIVSVALIISLALLASGTFTYFYFSAILKEQVIRDDTIKLQQTARQIAFIQNDIRQLAQYILVDAELQARVGAVYSADIYERLSNEEWLSTKLKNYLLLKDYIDSIVLVGKEERVISTNRPANDYYAGTLREDWYRDFLKRGVHAGFSGPHRLESQTGGSEAISYIIKFNPLLDPDGPLHYLIIHINLNHFAKAVPYEDPEFEGFYLADAGNTLLLGKRDVGDAVRLDALVAASEPGSAMHVETDDHIIHLNRAMDDDWKLVSVKATRSVLQEIDFILYFFILSTLVSIGIILLALTPIISNITRPISRLTQAMKQASMGKMNAKVAVDSGDEIQLLGEGFNRMLDSLDAYIRQSVEDEKIKRKLQLDLLLSQINPHFIYNTLNTVIYMAQEKGNRDIVVMMESFIRLLQEAFMVSEDGFHSTVSDEMESVRHYLVIQEYRYPDRFAVDWRVDEQALNVKVPRTILQPLVENALYHGIIPKPEKGAIEIRIQLREQRLHIRVADNGVGMAPSLIAQFESGRDIHRSDSRVRPIGLANVRDRLANLYGPAASMRIESEPGRGTAISIRLPAETSSPAVPDAAVPGPATSGF